MSRLSPKARLRKRIHQAPLFKRLGPGLITGAADTDPEQQHTGDTP